VVVAATVCFTPADLYETSGIHSCSLTSSVVGSNLDMYLRVRQSRKRRDQNTVVWYAERVQTDVFRNFPNNKECWAGLPKIF
jgi:hypothetical protein